MLVMPAYTVVNPFLQYTISKGLVALLNINSLFDRSASPNRRMAACPRGAGNIVRQRSIPGRTVAEGLRFTF